MHDHTLTCADLVLSCFKIRAFKSPCHRSLEQNSNISRSKPDNLT